MNNGTFAAVTLGDAMSRQSSGTFREHFDTPTCEPAEAAAYVNCGEGEWAA